jgi:hypothetical protein
MFFLASLGLRRLSVDMAVAVWSIFCIEEFSYDCDWLLEIGDTPTRDL